MKPLLAYLATAAVVAFTKPCPEQIPGQCKSTILRDGGSAFANRAGLFKTETKGAI